ncbi:MAG: shikimate dehydrogenase [Oscillospiraceae bacterium]|nr:shikimate dehydrogenase [Oscillospiraceae bacterium]
MEYGLIGEHLPHSFSKEIHEQLADYTYDLHELRPDELDGFMRKKDFKAINVTIPYKRDVIPYLDEISPSAAEIGAVNTIVNRDGKLSGFNTDMLGMEALIRRIGLDLTGKTVLILGTGGTSHTAQYVAKHLGAGKVVTVSRSGRDSSVTYAGAPALYPDAAVILNTTPAGMFPSVDAQAIDLSLFPALEGVADVVYNPLRTQLVQQAHTLGLPAEGGLYMLVGQAVAAVEIFLNRKLDANALDKVFASVLASKESIILTGMPGSGKTTVGKLLAKQLGRAFYDSDDEITSRTGHTPNEIIRADGEAAFRDIERDVIAALSLEPGCVIATGGGAILREENIRHLRANGRIFFLDRPISDILPTDDRPLSSDRAALQKRYDERYPIYTATADAVIPVTGTPEDVAETIKEVLAG